MKALRALRRIVLGWYYSLRNGEPARGYCPRCDACGEDPCCAVERCDGGVFCAGYYGDGKTRLRIIEARFDRVLEDDRAEIYAKARARE